MAKSTAAADVPEDTGRRVITRTQPVKVDPVIGGTRELKQAPDADIGPPEKPRQYQGERLKPGKSWNETRPRATGSRK